MHNSFAEYLRAHHGDLDEYLLSFFEGKAETDGLERYLYTPLRSFAENGGQAPPAAHLPACVPCRGRRSHARPELRGGSRALPKRGAHPRRYRGQRPAAPWETLSVSHRGVGLAINCGDLDLTLVTEAVLNDPALPDDVRLRVMRELAAMTMRTIEVRRST